MSDQRPSARDLTDRGRATLAGQAFSGLLGTQLHYLEPGTAELHLAIDERMLQQHGFVHGGVVSYLADNALTFAGGSHYAAGAVTGEMKINYLRPALGQMLIARAWTLSHGRRQAVARCDVFALRDGVEQICAAAQGTIIAVERDGR